MGTSTSKILLDDNQADSIMIGCCAARDPLGANGWNNFNLSLSNDGELIFHTDKTFKGQRKIKPPNSIILNSKSRICKQFDTNSEHKFLLSIDADGVPGCLLFLPDAEAQRKLEKTLRSPIFASLHNQLVVQNKEDTSERIFKANSKARHHFTEFSKNEKVLMRNLVFYDAIEYPEGRFSPAPSGVSL